MDFNKLTLKSQEAVGAAQELARRMGNPELYPEHLLLALLDQELPQQLVEDAAEAARAGRDRAARQAVDPGRIAAAAGRRRVLEGARPGLRRSEAHGRRLRLDRAPAARARRRPARRAAREDRRGARRSPRHLAGSRGDLPGAREVRPRPDAGRGGGQARPGDRARRGDPPRDPGPLAPHEEQSRADRRSRRRQDGDRRGPRAANRRGRRAGGPEGQARLGARHRRAARGVEVPRRVRGASQGGPAGDPGRRGADRPLHRRAAHDRRRRRGGGRGRRREPAQADAVARRAARGRCDDARRVPQAHREGRSAGAALPADLRRRAVGRPTRSRSCAG